MQKNNDIRMMVRRSGAFMYEVAEELGCSVTWLCITLRKDLTPEMRNKIIAAIDRAAAKKEGVL